MKKKLAPNGQKLEKEESKINPHVMIGEIRSTHFCRGEQG